MLGRRVPDLWVAIEHEDESGSDVPGLAEHELPGYALRLPLGDHDTQTPSVSPIIKSKPQVEDE